MAPGLKISREQGIAAPVRKDQGTGTGGPEMADEQYGDDEAEE